MAEVIDLAGRTLMPAIVGAQVHLSSYEMLPPPLRGQEPRPADLYLGPDRVRYQPRPPHVFTIMYRPAAGRDEFGKAVREQMAAGAHLIRIMATGARSVVLEDPEPAQFTPEEIRAVVEEAYRKGKRVAAHAEGLGAPVSLSSRA